MATSKKVSEPAPEPEPEYPPSETVVSAGDGVVIFSESNGPIDENGAHVSLPDQA